MSTFEQATTNPNDVQGLPENVLSKRLAYIIQYLQVRDERLSAQDGPARDTLEGCEEALRDVYLIATTGVPEKKSLTSDSVEKEQQYLPQPLTEEEWNKKYYRILSHLGTRYRDMCPPHTPLRRFIEKFQEEVKSCAPLIKMNRWLGFIQGQLIMMQITTSDRERDYTRSLFRPLDDSPPVCVGEKISQPTHPEFQYNHHTFNLSQVINFSPLKEFHDRKSFDPNNELWVSYKSGDKEVVIAPVTPCLIHSISEFVSAVTRKQLPCLCMGS